MVMAVFNPAKFSSRGRNARAQQERFRSIRGAILYTAELAYGDAPFEATDSDNPHHLQLRLEHEMPLWHKENLINLAVQRLLPKKFAALGFIDAEVTFENEDWAIEALRQIVAGDSDVVQPYSTVVGSTGEVWNSSGLELSNPEFRMPKDVVEWMTTKKGGVMAYSWIYSYETWQRIGGYFFDLDLATGNDLITFGAAVNPAFVEMYYPRGSGQVYWTQDYDKTVQDYITNAWRNAPRVRIGYVPGKMNHESHGSLKNRQYMTMRQATYLYEPSKHVTYNRDGILVPTADMPAQVKDFFMAYFASRKEDDAPVFETTKEIMGME